MSDDTHHPLIASVSKEQPNSGFALVIALSLMAFVLLLLLSIATLVSVETSSSAMVKQKLLAQNNALLGMQIALGNLQVAAGPDQRITSNAGFLDGIDPSKANYTVVWDAEVAAGAVAAPIAWLASGLDTSETGASATDADWLELVSARKTNGSDPDDIVEAVRAAPVSIVNQKNQTSGKMAWWVGDEGVKAKFNLAESTYLRDSVTDSDKRLGTSPRFGIEAIQGFETAYDYTDDPFAANLRKTISADQGQILNGDLEDPLEDHFHDLSFYSRGLLANTRDGGLKQDLTYYFEGGAGGPSDTAAIHTDGTTAMDRITWGQLNSFYNLSYDLNASDSSITARAQEETEVGIYPLLTVLTLNFGMTMSSDYFGTPIDPSTDDPSTRNYNVHAHIRPWFVLSNPYNVKLTVSNYRIRFDADTDAHFRIAYDHDSDDNTKSGSKATKWETNEETGVPEKVSYTPTAPEDLVTYSYEDLLENMIFVVPEVILEPGEALYYSLKSSDDASYGYTFVSSPTVLDPGDSYASYTDSEINASNPRQFVFEAVNDTKFNSIRVGDVASISGAEIEYTDGSGNQRIRRMYTLIDDQGLYSLRTYAGNSETLEDNEILLQDIGLFESEGMYDNSDARTTASRISWQGFWAIGNLPNNIYEPAMTTYTESDSYTTISPEAYASNFELHGAVNEYTGYDDRWDWHDFDGWATDFNIRAPRMSRYKDESIWFPGKNFSKPTAYALAEFGNMTAYTDRKLEKSLSSSTANYVWGAGYSDSFTQVETAIFFDIPRIDDVTQQPAIASLGQLQHFNPGGWTENHLDTSVSIDTDPELNTLGYTPTYAIGNSYAAVQVPREATIGVVTSTDPVTTFSDVSYLLNEALFDQYFFSTIPQDTSLSIEYDKLPNKRLVPINGAVADAVVRSSGTAAAENLLVDGAFNVNSTSVEAWYALLNSFRGFDFGDKTSGQGIFPRSLNQAPAFAEGTVDGTTDAAWAGWRHMEDLEDLGDDDNNFKLHQLAEAIVEEVKVRGPFVSMADFVNRRLVSQSEPNKPKARTSLSGALQAALDRTYNTDFDSSYDVVISRIDSFGSRKNIIDDEQVGSGIIYDLDGTSIIANASSAASSPGWVLQADLLQALEPVLTVRSDTFKIRSYGNVLDPMTGEVSSEAYVEAVVQRLPEYVDSNDLANTEVESVSLSTTNQLAGRRFVIVDIRFLDQSQL